MKLKKITDHHHDKYITTPEFNKLTAENFAARLVQANLASKNDITTLVKNTCPDDKGVYIVCRRAGGWEVGWRVLQIFQNIFRSPGDHRPKYFMAQ